MAAAAHDDGTTARFERLLVERNGERYRLRLFVTGMTRRSTEAVAAIKSLCEELLTGRYELEICDLYVDPMAARTNQVLAAPTLVRELPLPAKRLIGNLDDRERLAVGLDLVLAR
mgnify:CR=1 FL=1